MKYKNIFNQRIKKILSGVCIFAFPAILYKFTYPLSNINSLQAHNPIDKKNLRTITRREVSGHYTHENKIWVTYKDGVYDITDFIKVHPGGESKLMMAAGGAIEPFWEQYSFHKKGEVEKILENYRIGNLDPKDIIDPKDLPNFDQLKKDEIKRSPYLIPLQTFPYCADCPAERLVQDFYTKEENFFIRNHNTVPHIDDMKDYKFKIYDTRTDKKIKLTVEDLKRNYNPKTVECIIMCTGNRRSQIDKPGPTKGLPWNVGAIGNGKWKGVSVRELLEDLGYNKENSKGLHLISKGMDKDFQSVHYETSIPLELVFDSTNEIIVAYNYNDGKIPHEHGYPLRLIVPGVVGVRNVKWLKSLEVSENESQSTFQQRDYKMIPWGVDWEKVDLKTLKPLMFHKLNSVICEPHNGASVHPENGSVHLKGWAIGEYGSVLKKIEVSMDNGRTWENVNVLKRNINDKGKSYGWTIWEHDIKVKDQEKKIEIWVRAEDVEGKVQPQSCEQIWNIRGLMNNSIHKVNFNLI